MKKILCKKNIAVAALLCLVLALTAEGALLLLRKSSMPDYPLLTVSDTECGSWEFTAVDGGYHALAYNSYFEFRLDTPVAASDIAVKFTRAGGDDTETVIYCEGISGSTDGEFVFALYQNGDEYTARLNMAELRSVRIYPTEKVHTVVDFKGFTVNGDVKMPSYNLGEAMVAALGLSLVCFLVFAILLRGKEKPEDFFWAGAALFLMFAAGALCLAAVDIFGFYGKLQTALPIIGILAAAFAVVVVRHIARITDFNKKAAVLAFICALAFCAASLPLRVPDEQIHFLRAYTLSCGDFTFNGDYRFPDEVNRFVYYFCGQGYGLDGGTVGLFTRYFSGAPIPQQHISEFSTSIQILLPYILPAIFMTPARLLGANPVLLLYIGRVANAAMFALCFYYALTLAKRQKHLLVVTAFWPLCAFVTGSLSYDALYMSAFLVLLGSVLSDKADKKQVISALVSFSVMMTIKPTSFMFILLLWLLNCDTLKKLKIGALVGGCGILSYAAALLYAKLFAIGLGREDVLPGVNIAAQVKFVLTNPLRYIMVMLADGYQNSFYLDRVGLFGWLDAPTRLTPILAPVCVAAVGIMCCFEQKKQKKGGSIFHIIFLAVCYAVTVTGFYCAHSTLGSTSILGVQARYLTVCLPSVAALISDTAYSLRLGSGADKEKCRICSLWLCAGCCVFAAAELLLHYFMA